MPFDELPQLPSTRPNLPNPRLAPTSTAPSTAHKCPLVMRGGASLFSKADMEPKPDPARLRRVALCKRVLYEWVGADTLGCEDADVIVREAPDAEDCDLPAPALPNAAQEVLRVPGPQNSPKKGSASPSRNPQTPPKKVPVPNRPGPKIPCPV